jgi:AraC family transcriptional regulator, regulatory protein of adaptative response / DNA-3-methyladenine glycosylase II
MVLAGGVIDDFERCYIAVQSRDPRFDGMFFTAVTSTGIYCRPSCPAKTPMRANVRFYPTAAAAQRAGFRACKRCRPNTSPGSPLWDIRADVVARAMRLIADGLVDREGVPALAARLGYSVRQLERLLSSEVGAGPTALARAQRAQTARILIETTPLPMADIAFAAGFSSVRQFNETVRAVFASSPSQLRAHSAQASDTSGAPGPPELSGVATTSIVLRLPFRQPLCPDNLFGHLAATAVPGVEEVRGMTYRRTLRLEHGPGIVELTPGPTHISCRAVLSDLRDLTTTIARCRWLLDLDADPEAVDRHLATSPDLRPAILKAPGRRVPRCVDGAELAIRAVLGQQVSTAAAQLHASRMVQERGEPVVDPDGGLTHLFPSPEALEDIDSALPGARRNTLRVLVEALAEGRLDLGIACDRSEALAVLADIPGVGPWTTSVIAMRALGDSDAFPASDLGVRRGAEAAGLPSSEAALIREAEAWRPWRAYAVQYLWSLADHRINLWPPPPLDPRPTTRSSQPTRGESHR